MPDHSASHTRARLHDTLIGAFGWLGRFVHGFHSVLGVLLSLGLLLAIGALWAFAELAEEVMQGTTQRFDDSVLLWLHSHATPTLNVLALEITSLGSFVVVAMLVTVSCVFLWVTGHRYSAGLLLIALAGSELLNSLLKNWFDRPRPQLFDWVAPHAGQTSFPSGHAMTSVAVYATLAYLIARLETTHVLRWLTIGVAAIVIVLIGLSRLYLGVHYPSDVVAGFAAGFAWAACCAAAIEAVHYFRARRPGLQRVEHEPEAGPGVEPVAVRGR